MDILSLYLQQTINGVTLGVIYALVALGFSMVYGILEMINFAHGEVYMIGGVVGYLALTALGFSTGLIGLQLVAVMLLVLILAMLVSGAVGVSIERFAYRPLRNSSRLTPLISAIGVSVFLQNLVMNVLSARPKPFPPIMGRQEFTAFGASFTNLHIFIIVVSVIMLLALDFFIRRHKWGKAMRAVAQDSEAAGFMGIEVNNVISMTFLLGSIMAAVAGIMVGMYYGVVDFFMGFLIGLKAFAAAVLGGIGNLRGAMLGGIILGLLESFGTGILGAEWKDLIAFVVLIAVLVLRPQGLLGEELPQKV